MPRVTNAKDLPEDVRDFASMDGELVYGKELEDIRKQRRIADAKDELVKTDTLGNKAKAVGEDAFKTVFGFKSPDYGSRPFNKATKEHNDKVKRLKEEAGMKKGGKVSSASKRADGCCIRGKTRA